MNSSNPLIRHSFAQIDSWVTKYFTKAVKAVDPKVNCQHVYLVLCGFMHYAFDPTKPVFVGVDTIADTYCISNKSVDRAIAFLVKHGMITRQARFDPATKKSCSSYTTINADQIFNFIELHTPELSKQTQAAGLSVQKPRVPQTHMNNTSLKYTNIYKGSSSDPTKKNDTATGPVDPKPSQDELNVILELHTKQKIAALTQEPTYNRCPF